MNADFDTGNPHWFCIKSSNKLEKILPQRRRILRNAAHLGQEYEFYYSHIKVGLKDVNMRKICSEKLLSRVVTKNWRVFTLASPDREAFAGRALWTKIKFSVTLKPEDNITSIKLLD